MSSARSARPMRVAYLAYHVGLGGGELLLLNHLAHLNREEFDFFVVCTGEGPLPQRLRALEIPVFVIPLQRKMRVLGQVWVPSPLPVWQLAALLKRERAALIHSWTLDARNYANAVSILTGIPVIHSCQDPWSGDQFGRMQWWIMNRVPAAIVAISETARSSLHVGSKLAPSRVALIRGGIDLDRFPPQNDPAAARAEFGLAPQTPLVGFVGRMDVAVKGFDTFAQAIALLASKLPDARALIVGGAILPDDDAGEVMQLFGRHGLQERVILTGHRDDVPRLLACMDVVVSASPRECYPLVLMETAAAGRPAVTTRSGGGEEVVVDGVTGLVVPVRNAAAMAQALFTLLTDCSRAEAMGRAARQHALACFDVKRMARLLEDEYRRVVEPALGVQQAG